MALQRLQQTLAHLTGWETKPQSSGTELSLLRGATDTPLWNITLSTLLHERMRADPTRECMVFPEFGHRSTYEQLYYRSRQVAKGLLASGIQPGDHVGVLAGNCPQYVELLFATSHVGAALVVLNNTYTASELESAVSSANCKILFTAPNIGKASNAQRLDMLAASAGGVLPNLREVVLIRPDADRRSKPFLTYDDFIARGISVSSADLDRRTEAVDPHDVCNLQFTSGTTGSPKAALLTHNNIINNGRFIGDRMSLTPNDKICCPPPIFHCFGLVLGLLAVVTHGSTIVFPSETFDPAAALRAVINEQCTGLHGVPAMFSAELELFNANMNTSKLRLRTGIAAGAPIPRQLMEDIKQKFNLHEMTITYGMTETSPASFMTFTDDPLDKRLATVGRILPHTTAKIIDKEGRILPKGSRGELCVAGFALQKGYWNNPEKTAEAMRKDEEGVLWMHTGDEAMFDAENYCKITGRIKDIIIRGGENIFPLEIEERLVQHRSVLQASVVGLPDNKYGEVVGAFLQPRSTEPIPSDATIREFVGAKLGRHKVPVHIFWLKVGESFPQTGSAKIQKHVLRDRGAELIKGRK